MEPGFLELGDYGRYFPPQNGYTLMGWMRVIQFDSEYPIPIISIEDSEGIERLCISVSNKQRRKFEISTFKGTHVFDSFTVRESEWIHFAFVHQKPKITASTVSLFINGKMIETAKCGYLGRPGTVNAVTTYFGSKKYVSDSIYDLGPLYMFEEHILDSTVIAVAYQVGFEYSGNWQGTWSKYLVGNELLRSKAIEMLEEESKSPLGQLNFVLQQGKRSMPLTLNVPEEKVLFSISAANILESHNSTVNNALYPDECPKFFNGAYQKLGKESTSSVACLFGSVLSVSPNRIVDSIWSLGGSSIILKLINESEVQIMYNLVR